MCSCDFSKKKRGDLLTPMQCMHLSSVANRICLCSVSMHRNAANGELCRSQMMFFMLLVCATCCCRVNSHLFIIFFQAQQDPHKPQRIFPPPCPHQQTSAQRFTWSIAGQI